jgi:hypothetical protein
VSVRVPCPECGFAAAYLGLVYRDARGRELTLCTPIRVVGKAAEPAAPAKKTAVF